MNAVCWRLVPAIKYYDCSHVNTKSDIIKWALRARARTPSKTPRMQTPERQLSAAATHGKVMTFCRIWKAAGH